MNSYRDKYCKKPEKEINEIQCKEGESDWAKHFAL